MTRSNDSISPLSVNRTGLFPNRARTTPGDRGAKDDYALQKTSDQLPQRNFALDKAETVEQDIRD